MECQLNSARNATDQSDRTRRLLIDSGTLNTSVWEETRKALLSSMIAHQSAAPDIERVNFGLHVDTTGVILKRDAARIRSTINLRSNPSVDNSMVAKKSAAFPSGVAQPAVRALASIGVTRVAHLAKHREADVAELHGMGPKALGILKAALKTQGKTFHI